MNILLLTEDFPPMSGGIAIFLSELGKGLANKGNDARVLLNEMPGFSEADPKQTFAVIRYPTPVRLSSLRIGYQIIKQTIKNSTVKSFSRENRHTSPPFATKNKNLVWFISLN